MWIPWGVISVCFEQSSLLLVSSSVDPVGSDICLLGAVIFVIGE